MLSPRSILFSALLLCPLVCPAADPAQQIASFSAFKNINISDLLNGSILAERGFSPNFDRGINIQTCYVVRKPVNQTVGLLATWNPSEHKELNIYSARTFASGDEPKFEELHLDPSIDPVRRLLEDTRKSVSDSPSFQYSGADPDLLRKVIRPEAAENAEPDSDEFRKLAEKFWSGLLQNRYDAFRSGGITALPPYHVEDQSIPIHGELIALVSQAPAVQARFKNLLNEAVFQPASKAPAPPASYYWQVLNSKKKASCCLGAIYTKQDSGKWQVADYQLYSSHSYLTMITLFELWPLKAGSEDCTLVWRGDFVSAPAFSSLRGVEQMAAAALMIKSIKNNIRLFQVDATHSSAIALSGKIATIQP